MWFGSGVVRLVLLCSGGLRQGIGEAAGLPKSFEDIVLSSCPAGIAKVIGIMTRPGNIGAIYPRSFEF